MEKKMNFIRTTDVETKDKLIAEGFELISQDRNGYIFLNSKPLTFDSANKKIHYTNMLTF